MIDSFTGPHRFLSSFYPCSVRFEGTLYRSVENAWQAAKTLDLSRRKFIVTLTAGEAKRFAAQIEARPDWQEVQLKVFEELTIQKYQNPFLRPLLLETGDQPILMGNTWHDNFLGSCVCQACKNVVGENHAGLIIEKVRTMAQTEKENGVFW